MDKQAFRDHARELALSHLATMLAAFLAAPHSALGFDVFQERKLEAQLVRTLATFIEEVHLEELGPDQRGLARGLEDETHRLLVAETRERLEKSWPAKRPRGH
jgi:hypothetical protein